MKGEQIMIRFVKSIYIRLRFHMTLNEYIEQIELLKIYKEYLNLK